MHFKVEKIGVEPIALVLITLSSDELCSVDIAPPDIHGPTTQNRLVELFVVKKTSLYPEKPPELFP